MRKSIYIVLKWTPGNTETRPGDVEAALVSHGSGPGEEEAIILPELNGNGVDYAWPRRCRKLELKTA